MQFYFRLSSLWRILSIDGNIFQLQSHHMWHGSSLQLDEYTWRILNWFKAAFGHLWSSEDSPLFFKCLIHFLMQFITGTRSDKHDFSNLSVKNRALTKAKPQNNIIFLQEILLISHQINLFALEIVLIWKKIYNKICFMVNAVSWSSDMCSGFASFLSTSHMKLCTSCRYCFWHWTGT